MSLLNRYTRSRCHYIAETTSRPKLLKLDTYPLHEDFKDKFAEDDTYVLFILKGLTWSLQPLDCGFFKVLEDYLKKNRLKVSRLCVLA